MASTLRLLSENDDDLDQQEKAPQRQEENKANALALGLLLTALKALGQRTIVALAALQVAAAIGSALFIWYSVLLPAPSWTQITGATLYSAFVLMALWLRR